jgi:DNA-binding transcriptional MerR regulator
MITKKNEFTQKEVSELLGINPNTIAQHARNRLVVADIDDAKGRGNTRLYSRLNLLEFLFIQEIAKCGITQDKIKHIIYVLRHEVSDATKVKKSSYLLNDKNRISWMKSLISLGSKNRVYVVIINPYEKYFEIKLQTVALSVEHKEENICLPLITHPDNRENSIKQINEKEYFDNLLIINITSLCEKIERL